MLLKVKETDDLRRIYDDLYVFCLNRVGACVTVASRTRCVCSDGDSAFEMLRISESELRLLCDMMYCSTHEPMSLSLANGVSSKSRVMLLPLINCCTPICLAMKLCDEMHLYTDAEHDRHADEIRYISSELFSATGEIGYQNAVIDIMKITRNAARLVGASCTFTVYRSKGEPDIDLKLSCGGYAAAVICMLTAARRYSRCRVLDVHIRPLGNAAEITLSFKSEMSEGLPFEAYLSDAADQLEMPISFERENGSYMCRISPFLSDPAREGVKHPDTIEHVGFITHISE